MVSATGDWTKDTLEVEYPAMRRLYGLLGAESRVHALRFQAPHNYNRDSREAVYAWLARWLNNAPADVRVPEREFRPEALPDALVFHDRARPADAVTREQLTDRWIEAAKRQLKASDPQTLRLALLHALAPVPRVSAGTSGRGSAIVVLAGEDSTLHAALARAGFTVRPVAETPFDHQAAAKIEHFETYNRTAAGQRVIDIVHTIGEEPDALLVAAGDWGLPALLALALVPVDRAVVDVAQFDNASDTAFLERLYIPGIRRAGDLQTAVSMATGDVVVHNAGRQFTLVRPRVESRKLTPDEIVAALKQRK
jgi:hypothetical protein